LIFSATRLSEVGKGAAKPEVIKLREGPVLIIKPTGEVLQIAEILMLARAASELPMIAFMGFLSLILGISSRLCAP
jgi:hypothetical protein